MSDKVRINIRAKMGQYSFKWARKFSKMPTSAGRQPVLQWKTRCCLFCTLILSAGLAITSIVSQVLVDQVESVPQLVEVGFWAGGLNLVVAAIGFAAIKKNYRKIVGCSLVSTVSSLVFSVFMVVLPAISLPADHAAQARTWITVMVACGCAGLLLELIQSIIIGLSLRDYDRERSKSRKTESVDADVPAKPNFPAITIIVTEPEEDQKPTADSSVEGVEVSVESESPAESVAESIADSVDSSSSVGYDSIDGTQQVSNQNPVDEPSTVEQTEPIYAVPLKKSRSQIEMNPTPVPDPASDSEIQIDNGQHTADPDPASVSQWQIDYCQDEVSSSEGSTTIELSGDDIIVHSPPIDPPNPTVLFV